MTGERERFDIGELAVCLSHYDLGDIRNIREFMRGSRRAPKVVIECDHGKLLFKRRPEGRDEPEKVAFTHRLQLFLAGQNFPLPHLIGTRTDNNSMLICEGKIYELFEYIEGAGYDGSGGAAGQAGRTLGLYHKLTADYRPQWQPPTGSYHDAEPVHQAVRNVAGWLPERQCLSPDVVAGVVEDIGSKYRQCAATANGLGLNDWPAQMVHGDWHPGNLLFRQELVVAVVDYDSARMHARVIDLANGALQFSILGGGDDPASWPSQVRLPQFEQFLCGYDAINVITQAELKALPYLMCEAMIVEAILPIAATGTFSGIQGLAFLQMIQRKICWVLDHTEQLASALGG